MFLGCKSDAKKSLGGRASGRAVQAGDGHHLVPGLSFDGADELRGARKPLIL